MSDKRICQRTGKSCFSKREANETIAYFKTSHFKWNHRGKNIPQRSYYCEYCGTYHITHFKKKSRKNY